MISAEDWVHLDSVPVEARATAMWLWLHLDPLGRGLMNPWQIALDMSPSEPWEADRETVTDHLLMLMEAGFLTTYQADGQEWILLLHPLKVDLRRTRIETPEPPVDTSRGRPWTSMAVGRGAGASGRERARERARERVRAEDAARAGAWEAVARDREVPPPMPDRPLVLDAPQMFCDEHMPAGAGRLKCGPCRDTRLLREEWLTSKVYEEKLATYFEAAGDDDEPF